MCCGASGPMLRCWARLQCHYQQAHVEHHAKSVSMQDQMGSTLQNMSAYLGRHAPQRQGCAVLWMLLAHALSQGMAGEVAQQLHQPAHTSIYHTSQDDVHPESAAANVCWGAVRELAMNALCLSQHQLVRSRLLSVQTLSFEVVLLCTWSLQPSETSTVRLPQAYGAPSPHVLAH